MTRTEKTYYGITCLYRVAWSALGPIYALFLLDRGLDLLEISLVLATYLIVTCLFEVPTGAIADVFGRKASFVMSCLVRAGAFAMYYFSDSFSAFLVAEFIDAVGTTLATGAFDAWAVDGVRDEGDPQAVDRLFGRGQMLSQATAIFGGLGAAYLADRDLSHPWLIGTSGFLLCAVAGMVFMRENRPPGVPLSRLRADAYLSVRRTIGAGLGVVRDQPVLRGLCLITLVTSFAAVPTFQMWQPHLTALAGEGPWLMGWVWAFINLMSIAGSALIPVLVPRWGRAPALSAALVWRALTLGIAAAATNFPLALFGWLLQEVAFGFKEPVMQAWMNEYATSAQRATILSARSMAFTFGGAAGLICLGWLARETSIGTAWMVSAAIYALVAPGYLLLGRVARRAIPAVPVIVADR